MIQVMYGLWAAPFLRSFQPPICTCHSSLLVTAGNSRRAFLLICELQKDLGPAPLMPQLHEATGPTGATGATGATGIVAVGHDPLTDGDTLPGPRHLQGNTCDLRNHVTYM